MGETGDLLAELMPHPLVTVALPRISLACDRWSRWGGGGPLLYDDGSAMPEQLALYKLHKRRD